MQAINKSNIRTLLSSWRRWLAYIFVHDYRRKLFALAMGAYVWIYFNARMKGEGEQWDRVENVEVLLRHGDRYYVPEQQQPRLQLKTSVGGKGRGRHVSAGDFTVEIDLSRLPPPQVDARQQLQPCYVTLSVAEHLLRKPAGVTVTGFVPSRIAIRYDQMKMTQKPVNVPVTGTLKGGYRFEYQSEPRQVTVNGPAHLVDAITSVDSETLSLSPGMQHDFTAMLRVALPPSASSLRVYPEEVAVTVRIVDAKKMLSRRINGVGLFLLSRHDPPVVPEALPETVDVILRGPQEKIEKLTPASFHAYLDLREAVRPDRVRLPVQLLGLPAETEAEYINPGSLAVTLMPVPVPVPVLPAAAGGEGNNAAP